MQSSAIHANGCRAPMIPKMAGAMIPKPCVLMLISKVESRHFWLIGLGIIEP